MTESAKEINGLFDKYVPVTGKAETLGGEIVRAVCRIGYRWLNDGDQLGIGYGRETVNPAGRMLESVCDEATGRAVMDAWGVEDEDLYGERVDQILDAVAAYLRENPGLFQTGCEKEMFEYKDPAEDVFYFEPEPVEDDDEYLPWN